MTASTQCPHNDVNYNLNMQSFGDTNIRYLEIKGHCKICEAPMKFRCMLGVNPDGPTVSFGGDEVRIPLTFGDEKYDGKAIGFTARQVA